LPRLQLFVAAAAIVLIAAACHHEDKGAAPSASAPAASASTAQPIPITSVRVPATTESGAALGTYSLDRAPGTEGASLPAAMSRCRERGLSLCTETQWARACKLTPELATTSTWTASGDEDRGFIVRGGSTCSARAVVQPGDVDPSRGAVCCSRAIVVRRGEGGYVTPSIPEAKLLAFERAINDKRAGDLATQLEDELQYYRVRMPKDRLVAILGQTAQRSPDLYGLLDTCEVGAQSDDDAWSANCTKIAITSGRIGYVVTRFVFGAKSGKIRLITDANVYRDFSVP
jgi:hypothetical protein